MPELKGVGLSLSIGLDHEFAGNKRGLINDLLRQAHRSGTTTDLISLLRGLRPAVDWPDDYTFPPDGDRADPPEQKPELPPLDENARPPRGRSSSAPWPYLRPNQAPTTPIPRLCAGIWPLSHSTGVGGRRPGIVGGDRCRGEATGSRGEARQPGDESVVT